MSTEHEVGQLPFERLFEAAPEAILLCGDGDVVVSANEAASRLLGYSPEQLRGMAWRSLAGRGIAVTARDPLHYGPPRTSAEVDLRRRDGVVIGANLSESRYIGPDGNAWTCRMLRPTDRIDDARPPYRAIVEAMSEGVVMQDAAGRIFASNESAERILGIGRGELHGKTSRDPDWDSVREDGSPFPGDEHPAMVALAIGAPVHNVVMGLRASSGHVRWIRINSTPLFQPGSDRPHGVVSTFDDITARIEMQRALADSEARVRALIDNLPVLVSYWDTGQRCRLANAAHLEWFALDPGYMVGRHMRELLGEERYRERIQHVEAVLRGDAAHFEREIVDARGVPRGIQVNYVPDRQDGRVVGFFALATDVTELNRRVASRTRELKAAKDEAEAANRAKDEFIANVSHEMRTPLHAIKAYTRLAQMSRGASADPKLTGYLQRIDASNVRLTNFVESILSISSYESGTVQPDHAPVDPREILHNVARIMTPLFNERGQRLQLVPGDAPDRVDADGAMLEQVVTNLLANASRFSPEGSLVAVELCADVIRGDDGTGAPAVRLTVYDQGVGIPEDELGSIFEKFHRSTRTRATSGGTGLGLAITREIVRLHGGTIRAANNPGGGARFDVRLPVLRRTPPGVS
jgi:PAS domain S-box-containing protein